MDICLNVDICKSNSFVNYQAFKNVYTIVYYNNYKCNFKECYFCKLILRHGLLKFT